jgi:hypothetical protein
MEKIELQDQPNSCVHCGKKFMQERTLYSHLCEGKRRAMQKDEKRVQAGLLAFNRFFQLTQNSRKSKTYEEFCKSPYYNAFVKFGSFVNNVNPLYPDKFIDFVIKSGVKIDHWCKDSLYEQYLYDMIKSEPVESAVQRSIQTMMDWGDISQAQFNHYFNYVNHNRAVHDILNGKISPWLILNCSSGKKMINGFNDEQLELISPAFDVAFWIKKFKKVPADVALVKEICKEAGIE